MKIQDIFFVIALLILAWGAKVNSNPRYFVVAGLICLLLSMPLFHFWIFFTAQRLITYAFIFLLIAVLWLMVKNR